MTAALLFAGSLPSWATVTITPAAGGTSLSADSAANALSPAWTALGPITIAEGKKQDISAGANVTLVLKAPAGFQFNTNVTPSVSFTAGRDITSASAMVNDPATITVTLTVTGTGNVDTLVIGSPTRIQAQPTAGTPLSVSAHIYRPTSGGGTVSASGITTSTDGSSGSDFGDLSEVAGAPTTAAVETRADGTGISVAAQYVASGTSLTVYAISRDASGNFVTNLAANTWSLVNGNGGVVPADLAAQAGNRSATFSAHLLGTAAVHFTAGALPITDSGTLTVVPGAATQIRVETAPDGTGSLVPTQSLTAGTPLLAYAIKRDAAGNFLTNSPATWSLQNRTAGVANADLVPSGDTRSATFNPHLVGTGSLQASSGTLTAVRSGALTVLAGPATQLAFTTQPGSATYGLPLSPQPVLQSVDAFGNSSTNGLPPSEPVMLSLSAGSGPLLGTTTLDLGSGAANGLFAFTNLQVNSAGAGKQLTAACSDFTNAMSALFSVSPATLTFRADDQSRPAGSNNPPFTFTVSGLVNGDDASAYSGTPSLTTTATPASNPGVYSISITQGTLSSANYNFAFLNGTLSVIGPGGVVFFDDFSRPTDPGDLSPWVPVLGPWTITGGVLEGFGSSIGYSDAYVNGNWTNYVLEGQVQQPPGAFAAGLSGRLNPLTGDQYTVNIYPETGGAPLRLQLMKFHQWTNWSALAYSPLPAVGTNAHSLKLRFQDNHITAYFDGNQLIDAWDNGGDGTAPFLSGGIGAHLFDVHANYDNVKVSLLPPAPLAADDAYSVIINRTLSVPSLGVLLNDLAGPGSNLTAMLVTGPTNGTLSFSANGAFTYTPNPGFLGTDAFTYQANDGVSNSLPATVSISVVTGPPLANNDLFTLTQNSPSSIPAPGVLANDLPGVGSNLTAVLVSGPALGSLTLNTNGGFDYTPPTNFTGLDLFTYLVNDGFSNSAPATALVDVVPPGSLFFDDFNRPSGADSLAPWVVQAGVWTNTNGVLSERGAGTYADIYTGQTWSDYSVQTQVRLATNAWAGGLSARLDPATGRKYTLAIFPENSPGGPNILRLMKFSDWGNWQELGRTSLASVRTNWHMLKGNFVGPHLWAQFDGSNVLDVVDDGSVGSAPYLSGAIGLFDYSSAVSFDQVLVQPLLARPLATNDSYSLTENQTLNVSAPGVLANDRVGLGTNLSAARLSGPAHGTLNLNPNGSFTYSPATNYVGADSFTYQALDGLSNSLPATVTLTVWPLLQVSADNASRAYGQTNPVLTGTLVGVQNGDNITATYTTAATSGSPVGAYPILPVLSDPDGKLSGYVVITNNGTLTVTPAPLVVSADAQSKLYGDADPSLTSEIVSGALVNGDSLGGTLTRVSGESVGIYGILRGTLTASTNYNFAYIGANLIITPRPLSVAAEPQTKVYGQPDPVLSYHISSGSLVGSDSFTGSLTRAPGENVGTYPILQGSLSVGNNYSLSLIGTNLTITPKSLLAQADNQSRPYGATNPPLSITYTGFVSNDSPAKLMSPPQASTVATTNSPVGAYGIALSGGSDTNYNLVLSDATLTITPAGLTVTADPLTKIYGAADPVFSYQVTAGSLLNGDNLSGALSRQGGEDAGSYAILQGSLVATTNYSLTYVGANLEITPANSMLALGSSANPVPAGSNVVFTAVVSPVSPATATPTGNVQFLVNGSAVGSPVLLSAGTATFSTSLLSLGTNVIIAQYGGSLDFLPSTNNLAEVVLPNAQPPGLLSLRDNHDGTLTLTFSGSTGAAYVVLVTDDLASSAWTPLSTNSADPNGVVTLTATNTPGQRFYRAKQN